MKYLLVISSAILLFFSCNSGSTSTPTATVNSFIEAMKKGDMDGAMKFMTKETQENYLKVKALATQFDPDHKLADKMKQEFEEKAKNASISLTNETITGNNATVDMVVKENDQTNTQTIKLVKEDGWKISMMDGAFNMSDKDKGPGNFNQLADTLKNSVQKVMADTTMQKQVKEGMEKLEEFKKQNPEMMQKVKDMMKKQQDAMKSSQ